MGFGGISIWQLLIVLAIVVMIFGTKKLRNIGTDLGGAIKGFKKGLSDEDKPAEDESAVSSEERVIEGEAKKTEAEKVDREKAEQEK